MEETQDPQEAQEATEEIVEETPEISPGERLEEIFNAFERKGPTGTDSPVVYRFELDGDGGGNYAVRVDNDGVTRETSDSAEANVTVKLTVEDFLKIADGSFDGELAVRSERIEFEGDMDLVAKCVELINYEDVLA